MESSSQVPYPPLSQSRKPFAEDGSEEGDMGGSTETGVGGEPDQGGQADKNGPRSKRRYEIAKGINAFDPDDYYGILGLEKSSEINEIKIHYKKLAKLTHPDKSNWPDSKIAFQRVSTAYSVLKDPQERSSYDKKKPGKYMAHPVDANRQFGEEFADNAFSSDLEASEDGRYSGDNEEQDKLRPNEAHKAIYKEATPFIQRLLTDPPMTKEDKKESKKVVAAFNERIRDQNKADGLKSADWSKFYIQYTIFESNALLAKPFLDTLREEPEDSAAKKMLENFDGALRLAIRDNEYEDGWCYKALGFTSTKSQGGDHSMGGMGSPEPGSGGRRTKSTRKSASSTQEETLVKWKPGYTLTGEKIIAVIPKERTIRRMDKGIRGPAEQIVCGYQFIVKDEKEGRIELVSGGEIGQKATNGYLSLPEDQIVDARYSEKHYTQEDAESFDTLIDFTAKPFQTRSSNSLRHPNGYGLVRFKDRTQDVLSRTALRKMLGQTDADFEIQECEKRNDKIPAWKIQPLGWRQPRSMTIETPSKRRLLRQERVIKDDGSAAKREDLFVPQDRTVRQGNTNRRGRSGSESSGRSTNRGRSMSRSSSYAGEMADMRSEMAEIKAMIKALTLKGK